jgi:uncharacterized protein (DUF1330 family)
MSGYIVTIAKLTNVTPEFRQYAARAAEVVRQYGGSYLVRGPAAQQVEGDLYAGRTVIVSRFPTLEAARAFYESPEYAELKPLRAGTGIYDIGLFAGVD